MNRGKLVIILMFVIALSLTGYAWWFHYRQSKRVVEQWGSQTAGLIRRAKQVTLLRLSSTNDGPADAQLQILGATFRVTETVDISSAKGLIHVRHFLVEDTYYDWLPRDEDCQPNWTYALRFTAEDSEQTLVFDSRCHLVMTLPEERSLRLGSVVARLEEFVRDLRAEK